MGLVLSMTAAPVKFVRETYDEIKQVVWPTRNEVIRLTLIVIALSVLIGLYIGALDWIFTKAMELIFK
jgi:preprotein translocase subunit SecE